MKTTEVSSVGEWIKKMWYTHTHTHIYTHMYVYTHIHIRIYTYTSIHMRIYISYIHAYKGILFSHKQKEVLPFVRTW